MFFSNTDLICSYIPCINFKGNWDKKFNPALTQNQPFYRPAGEIEVPMMYQESKYRYGESQGLDAQV